jgi:hypothetical protein
MARWQYTTDKIIAGGFFISSISRDELERRLKERSEDGWEFVSPIPITGFYGGMRELLLIFRRPLP